MKILSIESSCDETSAAVVEKSNSEIKVLSNITATSLNIHATTGGIIPENAAREQVKFITPVIIDTLLKSQDAKPISNEDNFIRANQILKNEIDAIAVTYGPGLIGSLLVGVETVKTLSYVFDKPLIPVNHLLAHIYANFISQTLKSQLPPPAGGLNFPFIGLIVSGGHTDLLLFKRHGKFEWLGGTRDDAAGEAFDKIGRVLGLSYPAGPEIERRAGKVTNPTIKFKSPLINSDDFDFSFSGLKTEAIRFIEKTLKELSQGDVGDAKVAVRKTETSIETNKQLSHSDGGNKIQNTKRVAERHLQIFDESALNQICYATQKAIIDVLVKKTLRAAEKYNCKNILVGGGVSANQTLIEQFKLSILNSQPSISLFAPQKEYCTDNAAMIGAYALLNPEKKPWQEVVANPELYFS